MKKHILTLFAAAGLMFTSCDDILERPELNHPSDPNFWTTEIDARLFANGFYPNFFIGYGHSWSASYSYFRGYMFSDDVAAAGQNTNFPTQAPASGGYSNAEDIQFISAACGPNWQFSWIRRANLMKERLETMMKDKVSEEAYNHWHAVAAFFKCYQYCRLVQVYGDVPWFENTFEESDKETMFKDRDPRLTVMNNVYDLLKNEVLTNLYLNDTGGDGNTLNRYVGAAFAARWMLFEGTYQRYVLKNEEAAKKFLQLAVDAAEIVINSGNYAIATPFREVFGSANLLGNKEAIMVHIHDGSNVKHCVASYQNGNEGQGPAANLALLKSFICQDGKVYQNSSLANAEVLSLTEMAKTRDQRFEAMFLNHPDVSSGTLVYTSKFIDRKGLTLANETSNTLANYPEYNSITNTNDAPVIRYAEVLLSWIEAKSELGSVSQGDIDLSINALRARPLDATSKERGVQQTAPMKLDDITADFDPDRDADVSPLLWEIRRERRMEMAFEHSRLLDIKRWGKLHYMDMPQMAGIYSDNMLGPWVDLKNDANKMNGDNTMLTKTNIGKRSVLKEDGTVVVWDGTNEDEMVGYYIPNGAKPRLPIEERHYLYPVSDALINEYKDNGFTLTPTKGWE